MHRVMYELTNGEIPEGIHVLHKCDVRCCGNPDHLFLGTNLENIRDSQAKGRKSIGSRHAGSKLTESQVADILKDIRSQRALAKLYGVGQSTIWNIKKRNVWKGVPCD